MSNNLEAHWGEVVVYKQIPFAYQNITHPFSYSFRSSRASFYLNADLPQLILKKLNFPKPGFQDNWKGILAFLKQNINWASIVAVDFDSTWAPCVLYEQVQIKRLKDVEELEKRFHLLNKIKFQLLRLYDAGYYFKDFDEYNITVHNDKVKIMGWDSIEAVEPNKTFKNYYPWVWVL